MEVETHGGWFASRRDFLSRSSLGFGGLALASLLDRECQARAASEARRQALDLLPKPSHFPARAKSVIMLFQNGGPSQMDLFDPKPELRRRDGQKHPGQVESFQPGSHANLLMASPYSFRPYGECGTEFSQLLPNLGQMADELLMVRSMFSDNNNHPQALRCVNTGKIFSGRPTLGAWVSYALGTENENLPAYIVLRDPDGYNNGGTMLWENGWLPALYGGTEVQSKGAPVLNLRPAVTQPEGAQRNNSNLLARLNKSYSERFPTESELEARIRNYELAARMQASAGELLSLDRETAATRAAYGLENERTAEYGTRLLMARRLVEAGVRFVQVAAPVKPNTMPWDHHSDLRANIEDITSRIDLPAAALIRDLKQRGLLASTIVLWAGEFGRLPITQGGTGRDHNRHAFTILAAGGGFRAGHAHGATDEFGYQSVEKRVSCPDLLATLLHLLGLDHGRLSFAHNGREESLTDAPVTGAKVVADLLA